MRLHVAHSNVELRDPQPRTPSRLSPGGPYEEAYAIIGNSIGGQSDWLLLARPLLQQRRSISADVLLPLPARLQSVRQCLRLLQPLQQRLRDVLRRALRRVQLLRRLWRKLL